MIARSLVLLTAAAIAACYPVEEAPRRRGPAVPRHPSAMAAVEDQEHAVVTPLQPSGAGVSTQASAPTAGTVQSPAVRPPAPTVAGAMQPRTQSIRPAGVPRTEPLAPQSSVRPEPRPVVPSVIPAAAAPASAPAAPVGPVTARKAPGRDGYVISPHTGKLMLVRGIPSGTIVPDQTCPPGEKQVFRVP